MSLDPTAAETGAILGSCSSCFDAVKDVTEVLPITSLTSKGKVVAV
jgi:hypothetical protein